MKLRLSRFKIPRWTWILLGLLSLLISKVLSFFPAFTERFYSRGLFVGIRYIFDYTVGLLPIPVLYLAVGILLFFLIRHLFTKRTKKTLGKRLLNGLYSFAAFSGSMLFFFMLLWGWNYQRTPVVTQLGLKLSKPDSVALTNEFLLATEAMIEARAKAGIAPDQLLSQDQLAPDAMSVLRPQLASTLQKYGYPAPGRINGRRVFPKGLLMRLGASGIYIPYVGEGHIDAALPAVDQPATLIHEMAHAAGFGDEGICNFWAYVAGVESSDPFVRYSAHFDYWQYTARAYRRQYPYCYEAYRLQLPKGITADLAESYRIQKKYPSITGIIGDKLYDRYLKSQGVSAGVNSYSEVLLLVMAWRQKYSTKQISSHDPFLLPPQLLPPDRLPLIDDSLSTQKDQYLNRCLQQTQGDSSGDSTSPR